MSIPDAGRRTPKHIWIAVCALLLAASTSGCGYSLAGHGTFLPAYIKRIGIPAFANNSTVTQFNVEQNVTQKVRAEFIGRGKYQIVPDSTGVDALLTGTISSITFVPAAFNTQQQATRYALTLTAQVVFKDLTTDKVLWQNPSMQYREEFDVSTSSTPDPAAFFGQNANALDRMSSEFAHALVSAILEAF
ncbi:MAG: LPS assembly lipoprotein LptE [Vicinamibacterales bacterium]